ncbi:MAG: hypothetical protein LBU87_03360 [Lactobacillales bacterium]|nr:hypothetical protein [Lactobacillales bacterium]
MRYGKAIIDVCCGSKMFYFNKKDPRVLFQDKRELTTTLCDGRTLKIDPDYIGDFRQMDFANESFNLVVFDPPHLLKAGENSWLVKKYGKLGENWKDDLKKGPISIQNKIMGVKK